MLRRRAAVGLAAAAPDGVTTPFGVPGGGR
jgi:hypothetical protein